jgi:hypothetical protein
MLCSLDLEEAMIVGVCLSIFKVEVQILGVTVRVWIDSGARKSVRAPPWLDMY